MKYLLPKRFIAFIIDWYVSTLFCAIPVIITQSTLQQDLVLKNRIDGFSLPLQIITTIFSFIFFIIYFCVIPTRNKDNQTLGRRLLNLKLVKSNNNPITFTSLIIRDFICILLLQGVLTTANIYIMTIFQTVTTFDVVPYFQGFYYFILIISIILFFITKGKYTFHDWFVKTEVVEG